MGPVMPTIRGTFSTIYEQKKNGSNYQLVSNLTRAQTPFKPELGQVCVE